MGKDFKHLPSHSRPVHYEVQLRPDLNDFTLSGLVNIVVEILESTNELVLNSLQLNILSATFDGVPAVSIEHSTAEFEQTVRLRFPTPLPTPRGTLSVRFSGQLGDRMRGLYRSRHRDPATGEESPCALTMLCPTDARRVLPCWDEPQLKATFQVTLELPKAGLTALSNTPEEERRPCGEERELVRFAKTPLMSTYLLAIVVGRFDCLETTDSGGVLLRVFSPPGRREHGRFALEVARKSLPFYRQLFGIAYPLPKLDLVAVPELAVGAMENWGLITYRETMLLIDDNSSRASMETVALVVGHELAHQWFGNLVTMQWWTQLWLNEGFASWIEYLCVDHCYPEFDIWTRFIRNDLSKALELDSLENSHPIEVDVGHPDEIDELFDSISYSKGASVIRMLHCWLGEEAFCRGLQLYLNRHSYGNATTADLWRAMAEASEQPVELVMEAWVRRKGFPVISASFVAASGGNGGGFCEIGGNSNTLRLRQSRFRLGQSTAAAAAAQAVLDASEGPWRIPIVLQVFGGGKPECLLMEAAECCYKLRDSAGGAAWTKLNWGCVGVYRVEYSSGMLDALVGALQRGELGQRDRFNLQSDLFAMAAAGKVSTVRVLELIRSYRVERYFTVWSDLLANLGGIQVLADELGLQDAWSGFVRELCQPAFDRLGWDPRLGEGHDAGLLRGLLLACLGRAGQPDVVSEALVRFGRHVRGEVRLPPAIRSAVYATVARHGGPVDFEQLLALLDSADTAGSAEEELRILRSLGSTEDESQARRILELAASPRVRQQDAPAVICALCAGGGLRSRRLAWEFVKRRWDWLLNRYAGLFLLQRLVLGVCSGLCSAEDAADLRGFFADHPAPSAERAARQSMETVCLRAAILQADGPQIARFLDTKL